MPTSRNARGVDIVIYSEDSEEQHTIQVKSLSKRYAVSIGGHPENLTAEFLIVVREVLSDKPSVYIAKVKDIKPYIKEEINKKGEKSYWLNPKDYESFENKWDIIKTQNGRM